MGSNKNNHMRITVAATVLATTASAAQLSVMQNIDLSIDPTIDTLKVDYENLVRGDESGKLNLENLHLKHAKAHCSLFQQVQDCEEFGDFVIHLLQLVDTNDDGYIGKQEMKDLLNFGERKAGWNGQIPEQDCEENDPFAEDGPARRESEHKIDNGN